MRNGRKSLGLNKIYWCACMKVFPSRFMLVIAPLDSSGFLGSLLGTFGVLTKYREQNVNNLSTM